MAISEAARADLYTGLSELLGPNRAETLMSAIPLHSLDEVATKADLAVLRAELKEDIAGVRSELSIEMAQLRSELMSEIGALRKTMTTWMLTILVSIIGAMSGVALLT